MSNLAEHAAWRQMLTRDLDAVMRIAEAVHPGFPERRAVMAERQALHPAGCLVLARDDEPLGYLLSHPWHAGRGVPLDTLIHALPEDPGTHYLHDLALLPAARGGGAGADAVRRIADLARAGGLASLSLVAVNGSVPFWARQGFAAVRARDLGTYGADAAFMVMAV